MLFNFNLKNKCDFIRISLGTCSGKRLVAAGFLHAHMELDGMKCDADLQARNVRIVSRGYYRSRPNRTLKLSRSPHMFILSWGCARIIPTSDNYTDRSFLPNSVLLVGSGSVEKVAKIFPKIKQSVKKVIFSFPILLRNVL